MVTRILPYHDFNKITIVVINFLVVALLFTVLNHNKFKDKNSKYFLFMGIFILIWVDFAYLARLYGLYNSLSETLLRIAWFATPMLFYITYATSTAIANVNINKKINSALLALAVILSLSVGYTDMVIKGVEVQGLYLDIIFGPAFFVFLFFIFIFMIATVHSVAKAKRTKASSAFLAGVLLFYFLNVVFNITLPVFFGNTHLYFIGDYSTILLLILTAYAMLRFNLFDVKVIATEILTLIMLSILWSNILLSGTSTQLLVNTIVFLLSLGFGILLIRSVNREVIQREKLEELTDKLKDMDKQKNEFIAVAAHELRTPLAAVKGYTSMLIGGDAGELPGKAKEFLNEVGMSSERMVRLIDNLLDVGRIEEGRIVYQMGELNLKDVIDLAYTKFKKEAKLKNMKLTLDMADNLKDRVHVDKDRIHEVIGNLLSNAIKYSLEGEVKIKVFNPDSHSIKVEVIDKGVGIPKDEQSNLFHKFYRAKSNAAAVSGTGLGLYVSRLLIEKFSGKIGMESVEGKGSTFWFELPVVRG
jgi:signal transduction histidine kinase